MDAEGLKLTPSDWQPERDPVALAALGKLGEEISETITELVAVQKRILRCVMQGIDGRDPDSGLSNRTELRKEITDVEAMIAVARCFVLGLDRDHARFDAKVTHKTEWIARLRRPAPDTPA